ncbi:MAG: hypothetical protein HY749_24550 [Gammaproteobacteria bacterium]|nr:hypothetical protein [Gammaproteobacteria bacterium]
MAPKLTHALALAALCASGPTAHAESFYVLDSYADSNGAGPDLVPGGGTLGGGLYAFGQNQGLNLDWSGFDPAGYTIELEFREALNKSILDFSEHGRQEAWF